VIRAANQPKVAFLFTGQGAQFAGMGLDLYRSEAVFRKTIDRCDELLAGVLASSLRDVMFKLDPTSMKIDQTSYTQPAMFALQWALVELWKSWGIQPSIVLGHSIGELAAACAAGLMTWQSGLLFAARRGALMQSLKAEGQMLAILDSRIVVSDFLQRHSIEASIAASNGPNNTVISGPSDEIERAYALARDNRLAAVRLTVSHAFHSQLMDPILDDLLLAATSLDMNTSQIPLIANLTGELVDGGSQFSPEYFQAHARSEICFAASVATLQEYEPDVCIEIGPDSTLTDMSRKCTINQPVPCLPSLKRGKEARDTMLRALGSAFEVGASINHAAIYGAKGRVISLPTYPFQRTRFWESLPIEESIDAIHNSEAIRSTTGVPNEHPLLGRRVDASITLFSNTISSHEPEWLADHCVFGKTVFPGAGFVEMAMSAAKISGVALHPGACSLRDVRFVRPLVLSEETVTAIQCTVLDSKITISAKVRPSEDTRELQSHWQTFATAATALFQESIQSSLDLPAALVACNHQRTSAALYNELSSMGLHYGERFRRVTSLWLSDSEAWGEISCIEVDNLAKMNFSPLMLDASFHVVAALLHSQFSDRLEGFVPVGIEQI